MSRTHRGTAVINLCSQRRLYRPTQVCSVLSLFADLSVSYCFLPSASLAGSCTCVRALRLCKKPRPLMPGPQCLPTTLKLWRRQKARGRADGSRSMGEKQHAQVIKKTRGDSHGHFILPGVLLAPGRQVRLCGQSCVARWNPSANLTFRAGSGVPWLREGLLLRQDMVLASGE